MTVAIKKVDNDVAGAVAEAMDLAGFRDALPKSSTVLVKVNLGWDLFIPGSVTNPAVFEAVIHVLKVHAAKIFVVESDQVLENVEKAFLKSRMSDIAKAHGIPWVNLSREKIVLKYLAGNRVLKHVPVPEILTRGLVLSLPVMKTHDKTTVTLCLKNQWGCIPKMRHRYHLFLTDAISDVNAAVGPKFAVVDGTIAMEGNAPKTGIPRVVGIVGAGSDLVEVDSVFAGLMGFDPKQVSHIAEAERRGLGKISASYVGDKIDPLRPFFPARSNLVSRVELSFRRSSLNHWIFDTPVFSLMLFGAKLYYYAFEMAKGRRIRKAFRTHPLYGRYY
jgi:uncharacterized protein (DUF362 family)